MCSRVVQRTQLHCCVPRQPPALAVRFLWHVSKQPNDLRSFSDFNLCQACCLTCWPMVGVAVNKTMTPHHQTNNFVGKVTAHRQEILLINLANLPSTTETETLPAILLGEKLLGLQTSLARMPSHAREAHSLNDSHYMVASGTAAVCSRPLTCFQAITAYTACKRGIAAAHAALLQQVARSLDLLSHRLL